MDDKPGEWFVEWSFVLKIKRPFKTAGEGWRQITIVNITIIIIAPMLSVFVPLHAPRRMPGPAVTLWGSKNILSLHI